MSEYPPYYIVPHVEEYKKLSPTSEEALKLARRIATNIGDYASLRHVLGMDPPEFARFYADIDPATPDTFDTIDSFLDKFGQDAPVLGYMATQMSVPSETVASSGQKREVNNEEVPDNELKKLMSQGRYREALQLIEAQNLNNPNKSIYFAHQMRFLKKLVALENFRNQTQG